MWRSVGDRGTGGWQRGFASRGEEGSYLSVNCEGCEGWISVEWEKRRHPEIEEPEVALPRHLPVLRAWLTELDARA